MTKKYDWLEEAVKAIREHFKTRNMAKGQPNKRVVLRRRFREQLPSGDITWSYTYGGETVFLTKKAYCCEVKTTY